MRTTAVRVCDVSDSAAVNLASDQAKGQDAALNTTIIHGKSAVSSAACLPADGLQEMVKEYFGGLAKSRGGTASRLSVYLFFDNTREPLTPAEYKDAYSFFKSSR